VVIADTDVFIAALRGNAIAEKLLLKYRAQLAVSAIPVEFIKGLKLAR
jgi:hypothetical protein